MKELVVEILIHVSVWVEKCTRIFPCQNVLLYLFMGIHVASFSELCQPSNIYYLTNRLLLLLFFKFVLLDKIWSITGLTA